MASTISTAVDFGLIALKKRLNIKVLVVMPSHLPSCNFSASEIRELA
jgi:hypothetical protein